MANSVLLPIFFMCFISLHLTFASLKSEEYPDVKSNRIQAVEKRASSAKIEYLSILRDSGKYYVDKPYFREIHSQLKHKANRRKYVPSHRYRRGVFSWIASYFQSNPQTTKQPLQHPVSKDVNMPSNTTQTLTKPEMLAQKQSEIRGRNVESDGMTRVPRTTMATGITEVRNKVDSSGWLSTVSEFLHSSLDSSTERKNKNGVTSNVDPFFTSTPAFIQQTPTQKANKPHKIRHHRHHPEKVRGNSRYNLHKSHSERERHDDLSLVESRALPESLQRENYLRQKAKDELKENEKQRKVEAKDHSNLPCKTCGLAHTDPDSETKSLSEDEIKEIRKNMIAELLMQKMRLDPSEVAELAGNSSLKNMKLPLLPRAVLDETRERNSFLQENDDFYARDQEAIVAGEDMGRDCIKMQPTGCYNFRFNGRVKGEVESAKLWLYKTRDRRDIHEQTFIVYELERPRNENTLQRRNLVARESTFTKEGWVTVNMTRPVRRWLEKQRDGEMLAIRCKTCEAQNYRAVFGTKHGYKPLLIIKYADKYTVRDRRSEDDCNPVTECCKRPLSISFHDINMPTILEPSNLSVGYCFGYCDGIDSFTYNHTTIKQRLRWTHPISSDLRAQLTPCCVPLQLKDTFILNVENNLIVRKILPKVIVERCGCV
ncbi:growth/differentiation factor 8 [Plakobranchus ocellatus]|uniref:Growth/differentiation factor 8 n=1 Tax=Plakobranchus ocellatus TaxID=259542 RepID=A0AAV4D7P2_9GAST|nr:growth/differentiation factor 8 [Plakobranchus ocellatus]